MAVRLEVRECQKTTDLGYQLTDYGRTICCSHNIDPGPKPCESLEHMFWVNRAAKRFEKKGYEVSCEHPVKGNGAVDILAQKPGQTIAVEVETGKSDVKANLAKNRGGGFDKVVFVATSPAAAAACQRAVDSTERDRSPSVELLNWLDILSAN